MKSSGLEYLVNSLNNEEPIIAATMNEAKM